MEIKEAINKIQKHHCGAQYLEHHWICTDDCRNGKNECEYAMAVDAMKMRDPQKMKIIACDEYKIARCPTCQRNLARAWIKEGAVEGIQGIGDVPDVSKYCKFCGQALVLDWEAE